MCCPLAPQTKHLQKYICMYWRYILKWACPVYISQQVFLSSLHLSGEVQPCNPLWVHFLDFRGIGACGPQPFPALYSSVQVGVGKRLASIGAPCFLPFWFAGLVDGWPGLTSLAGVAWWSGPCILSIRGSGAAESRRGNVGSP